MRFSFFPEFSHLRDKPFTPQIPRSLIGSKDIFKTIREEDRFLHHPYESFDPVVDFIKDAAADPKVLAIKQTLYRVSGDSPIIEALIEAASNGKQVTVLVELKARFDEENNIVWARKLDRAGCHVIYGLPGLKIHCKLVLVVRKESDGIRRYVHLGTGNYNDSTAKLYTDMGMFTAKDSYASDVSALFNVLSGYSKAPVWQKLAVAPSGLRAHFYDAIDREIAHAKSGRPAKMIAKMNSLIDTGMTKKLYEASQAGVEITLIIRGICGLVPGVAGLSDNITVRSIVGRFLEHSRIYYFYNGGAEDLFLSSADWMSRNLNRRIEVLFPVEDAKIKRTIYDALIIMLADNVKARIMNSDGTYSRIDKRGKELLNSQAYFCNQAIEQTKQLNLSPLDQY
jgi:polyphosphate kinase